MFLFFKILKRHQKSDRFATSRSLIALFVSEILCQRRRRRKSSRNWGFLLLDVVFFIMTIINHGHFSYNINLYPAISKLKHHLLDLLSLNYSLACVKISMLPLWWVLSFCFYSNMDLTPCFHLDSPFFCLDTGQPASEWAMITMNINIPIFDWTFYGKRLWSSWSPRQLYL